MTRSYKLYMTGEQQNIFKKIFDKNTGIFIDISIDIWQNICCTISNNILEIAVNKKNIKNYTTCC